MKSSVLVCCVLAAALAPGLVQERQADPNPHPYPRVSASEMQKRLVRQHRPSYPPLAKQARIEGDVQLEAVIDTAGTVTELRALSGPEPLIPPALDAVKQWKYKPVVQNGKPVTVQTYITVQFRLDK
jgi:protein TonB